MIEQVIVGLLVLGAVSYIAYFSLTSLRSFKRLSGDDGGPCKACGCRPKALNQKD